MNPFSVSGFTPRWDCGEWSLWLGSLHIVSDALIASAYLAIPLLLVRSPAYVPGRAWLLAFILLCGVGHAFEVVIMWSPIYRFTGLWKAATAIVSLVSLVNVTRAAVEQYRELRGQVSKLEDVANHLDRPQRQIAADNDTQWQSDLAEFHRLVGGIRRTIEQGPK